VSDTPTPRTDAEKRWAMDVNGSNEVVCADFARQLERELAEANETTKHAKSYKRVLKDENARLRREIESYEKEIPDCIQSAKDAHLQNWEQLSIIGVLRRFPQICHWYKTSERELAEARAQRDALAGVALDIRAGYGGQVVDADCPCEDCKFLAKLNSALATLEGRTE
jgi:hypothetical protein